jgi:hypothetical protein
MAALFEARLKRLKQLEAPEVPARKIPPGRRLRLLRAAGINVT